MVSTHLAICAHKWRSRPTLCPEGSITRNCVPKQFYGGYKVSNCAQSDLSNFEIKFSERERVLLSSKWVITNQTMNTTGAHRLLFHTLDRLEEDGERQQEEQLFYLTAMLTGSSDLTHFEEMWKEMKTCAIKFTCNVMTLFSYFPVPLFFVLECFWYWILDLEHTHTCLSCKMTIYVRG